MKLPTFVSKLVLCIVLFLLAPGLMFANSVTVDCTGVAPGTFVTITAALASLTPAGPNDINVTCNSSDNALIVGFSNLTIFSALPPGPFTVTAANPARRSLNITDSKGIFIDGIIFSGGTGVVIADSTNVQLGDGGITNSSQLGLLTRNSVVDIFGSSLTSLFTIQNSTRSGISAQGGTLSLDGGVTITNNARFGVAMTTGHLFLNGGDGVSVADNVISNNGFSGVLVQNTAQCDAGGGNDILNNSQTGLQVLSHSAANWFGGSIIGNQGVGVHIGQTSHGEFSTVNITGNGAAVAANGGVTSQFGGAGGMEVVAHSDMFIDGGVNVSNNLNTGVFVNESSVLSSLGGNTINGNFGNGFLMTTLAVSHFYGNDSATGNTLEPFECDDSSVLIDNPDAFAKARCAAVKIK